MTGRELDSWRWWRHRMRVHFAWMHLQNVRAWAPWCDGPYGNPNNDVDKWRCMKCGDSGDGGRHKQWTPAAIAAYRKVKEIEAS